MPALAQVVDQRQSVVGVGEPSLVNANPRRRVAAGQRRHDVREHDVTDVRVGVEHRQQRGGGGVGPRTQRHRRPRGDPRRRSQHQRTDAEADRRTGVQDHRRSVHPPRRREGDFGDIESALTESVVELLDVQQFDRPRFRPGGPGEADVAAEDAVERERVVGTGRDGQTHAFILRRGIRIDPGAGGSGSGMAGHGSGRDA